MNKQDLLVSVSDLNKSYQDGERIVTVLEGVDLQLQAGEMLAIIGASGSGKSTLLHILGGLDKADSGQVTIAGEQPLQLPQHKLAQWRNQHVGFIYQFHHKRCT